MAAPTLTKDQRAQVIEMLAARESYAEIARVVKCTIANIDYYAKRNKVAIERGRAEYDARHADRGYRSREKRIDDLEELAYRLKLELQDREIEIDGAMVKRRGFWVPDVKVSSKMKVKVDVFAEAIIKQYRATLDDIAREMNQRVQTTKQEHSGPEGGPIQLETNEFSNLTSEERASRFAALLQSGRDRASLPPATS